jgi:hypothetical protein
VDGEHGVDNIGGKLLGEGMVKLGGERGASDREEQLSVNGPLELELVKELRRSHQTQHLHQLSHISQIPSVPRFSQSRSHR